MKTFTKITVGFVTQTFEKDKSGKYVCSEQEFIAGDTVDYENVDGEKITPPVYEYQPFEMVIPCGITQRPTLGLLEAQLLEACKTLTSYTMDLLYRLDDQVNINDVDEVQQARDVIEKYTTGYSTDTPQRYEITIEEQAPDFPPKTIEVSLLVENGQLWLKPEGYGEKCTEDGEGSPIGIEIWQGKLRLIAFTDINSEDPQIIEMENAREELRKD